jgi:tellurite resistance protein TehA-like permease
METLLIYAVVAGLLIWRNTRPQKVSVWRLLVAPLFLVAMTAFSIWGTQQYDPAPLPLIGIALGIGALLGAPLGYLRGRHTNVRRTDRSGVMYLDPSWVVLAIWLGAFVARAFLRYIFHTGYTAAIVGDGLLGFAVSAVIVSYYVIYRKYKWEDSFVCVLPLDE